MHIVRWVIISNNQNVLHLNVNINPYTRWNQIAIAIAIAIALLCAKIFTFIYEKEKILWLLPFANQYFPIRNRISSKMERSETKIHKTSDKGQFLIPYRSIDQILFIFFFFLFFLFVSGFRFIPCPACIHISSCFFLLGPLLIQTLNACAFRFILISSL